MGYLWVVEIDLKNGVLRRFWSRLVRNWVNFEDGFSVETKLNRHLVESKDSFFHRFCRELSQDQKSLDSDHPKD